MIFSAQIYCAVFFFFIKMFYGNLYFCKSDIDYIYKYLYKQKFYEFIKLNVTCFLLAGKLITNVR